jgi:hypothetical protein
MQERQMMIRLPNKLHKAARLKAVDLGLPLSEVVRDLLARWVDGSITLPQPTEAQPEESKPKRSKT